VFTTLVEYIFDGFPVRLKITIDSDITAANNFHVQPPGEDYSNKVPEGIPKPLPFGTATHRSIALQQAAVLRASSLAFPSVVGYDTVSARREAPTLVTEQ
jgi:hypothetical protein